MNLQELPGEGKLNKLEGQILLEGLLARINQCQRDLEAAQKTWGQATTIKEQIQKGGESFDIVQKTKEEIEKDLDKIFALEPQDSVGRILLQSQVKQALKEYDWERLKEIFSKLKEKLLK